MKKIILVCIVLLICSYVYGQIAYYDALFLKSKRDPHTEKILLTREVQQLLLFYYPDKNEDQITPELMDLNPLLKGYFDEETIEATGLGFNPLSLSSIGSLDVTNFADGLAKFLVERVKKELTTTFFEGFKKELEKNKQINILFPATSNALSAIDKEIYNYTLYLDLLRESFQKDLTLLLPNLKKLVDDDCMNPVFAKFPEIETILSGGLYITIQLSNGKFPGEAIHDYMVNEVNKDLLEKFNKNLYPALATLDLFSQSVRSNQADRYWLSTDSLKLLYKNADAFKIYLGLLYQQASVKEIKFNENTELSTLIEKMSNPKDPINSFQDYLTTLIDKGSTVQQYFNAIKEIQKSGKDKPTYLDYYNLIDASLGFIEFVNHCPIVKNYLPADDINDYITSLRSCGNIYIDLYEKQFGSAIVEFTSLFNTLMNKNISGENRSECAVEVKKDFQKTLGTIVKYGSFAASIVNAENSDEVQKAIETVALPPGSSRIKRESAFNVSLNAYTGLFTGHEIITGAKKDKHVINSYGITAPVGAAISGGVNHWSLSAFVSFIDVGTVAAFRFQNDTIAEVPTIQLQDIFSPGLFFSIGFPKCPLSLNLGGQVGPNLRKIYTKETGELINEYDNNVYWRFSISLVVDIPIFNFYTKSK